MKREFLEITEPAAITTAKGDTVLTAKITGDILEVDMYEKGELLARHFIEKAKKKYATLFKKDKQMLYGHHRQYAAGEWSNMKLETLLGDGELYYWISMNNVKVAEEHKQIIFSYLEEERGESAARTICNIENEYGWEKKETALERKEKRIADRMEKVEWITDTKEFKEWLLEVFPQKYIFTENRNFKLGRRYYCTSCGGRFYNKEKWKHNTEHECKKCGAKAIVKTRTINIREKKSVIVFQQYDKDTVVERIFRFQCHSYLEKQKAGRRYNQQERIRLFLKEGRRAKMYYGTDSSEDADEYMQGWWDRKNGMLFDKKYLVYPGTIKDTTLPKILKEELLMGASEKKEMDYNRLVYTFKIRPFLEYLFKGKLFHLASAIIDRYSWAGSNIEFLDINAMNIPDLLKLDKQRVNRMRDMDGNISTLKALQYERQKGEKISQENLQYITEHEIDLKDLQVERTGLTVNKAVNYLNRQMQQNKMSIKQVLQFYRDYIDMAADRGMELTDDIVRVNKRMLEFHNKYLEEKNRKANEKRARELEEKYPNIRRDYEINTKMFGYKDENFVILAPRSAAEIMVEGQAQHHCVAASDTYFTKMNDGVSYILFLRKKEQPETAYYTLEVMKNGEVKQAYGAYDRQPDYESVKKTLGKWKKEIKKRMGKEQKNGRIASERYI